MYSGMKRPSDQAKLFIFGLLRTVSALASTEAAPRALYEGAAASKLWQPPALTLRLARRTDIPSIQRCNLATLPENYNSAFYTQHLRQWPELSLVVVEDCQDASKVNHFNPFPSGKPDVDSSGTVVAYVLGRIESRRVSVLPTDSDAWSGRSTARYDIEEYGHITSLAVLQDYRRRGLAKELLEQLHHQFSLCHKNIDSVGLHVRQSNEAAVGLYREKFGYEPASKIDSYYQDGEDGYYMVKKMPNAQSQKASRLPFTYQPGFLKGKVQQLDDNLVMPRFVGALRNDDEFSSATSSEAESEPELLNGT